MAKNITLMGASYSNVPAVQLPQTGGGTARFDDASVTTAKASDVASGKIFLASDGTITTGTSSGGGGMNVQYYDDYDYSTSTSYAATDVSVTVDVSGTYTVMWVGWRNTTSGTSGSQLYINDSSYGSAHTTFQGSYGQSVSLTNVKLNADDVLVVRARARSTSYRMYVANLVIIQTS